MCGTSVIMTFFFFCLSIFNLSADYDIDKTVDNLGDCSGLACLHNIQAVSSQIIEYL